MDAVAASIREFGFRSPIIVDGSGEIIAGHTRYKAAKKLGLDRIPVLKADDLTEEQVRAYRLADNKTAELSGWDWTLLDEELDAIEDIDMEEFGFDLDRGGDPSDTIDDSEFVPTEVEVPEPPEEPETIRGDIIELGAHRLMCGDSTSLDDVENLMAGDRAAMVFTDPPWNVAYGSHDNLRYKSRSIINDDLGSEFPEFIGKAFSVMHRVVADGAMCYIVMSAQEWGPLMDKLTVEGFHWSSTIIWAKDTFVLSRKDYHTQYEPIWYGWEASAPRLHPLDDRTQSDLWEYPKPRASPEHPTMKPVALVAQAVRNSSSKGDVVLDIFGGSGTTLLACEETGRRCRMMELEPRYCDVIVKRWESLTGKRAKRHH